MDYKEIVKKIKNKELKNINLFYGTESYIVDSIMKRIKKDLISVDFEALNYQSLEGEQASVDNIINACETLPFMGECRLVIVKNLESFSGKRKNISEEEEKRIIKYFSNIPNTTYLIFTSMEAVDKRKKVFKEIKKYGDIGEFNKLIGSDLYKWVEKRFKEKGKRIELKNIRMLLDGVGYEEKNSPKTLMDLENEISKIVGYVGENEVVKKEDIEALSPKTLENNIFILVECLGSGKIKEALSILNDMVLQGEPIVRITHMIIRQFRYIYQVKLMLAKGYTNMGIGPKLGIQQFVVSKYVKQSKEFTLERLKEILEELANTDKDIKSGKMEPKLAVEIFIVGSKS
ncbi:DNA polymerase III subunit delta [Anaeromicrobium sediminis]|uniref:DNA polymerase III subunit delta n=1 Tax=Anaeromicrobium sediminis TaxID=1478221 RepID=A0A267MHA9_9FIRM|nr:DNA polymerase III subunit delta [Anaeromicrobium sediminis]PAB58949.1 DNA polymerase III subunit delta [Anaeromicrobium sediminis]